MKSSVFVLALAFSFLFLSDLATAGAWLDSRGFGQIDSGKFTSFTPTTGSVSGILSVTDLKTGADSLQHTGAFADIPADTTIFAGKIDFIAHASPSGNIGKRVSIGTTPWGSFTGTVQSDNLTFGGGGAAFRSIRIFGTFSIGSNPIYDGLSISMVGSTLDLNFYRFSGGSTAPIFADWALSTIGAYPIPEPTSIVFFGAGCFAFAVRRRAARNQRATTIAL